MYNIYLRFYKKTLSTCIKNLVNDINKKRKYFNNETDYKRWAKKYINGALENFAKDFYIVKIKE